MDSQQQEFRIPKRLTGKRLDEVLATLLAGTSRSRAQKMVRRGLVEVDGRRPTRSNVRLGGGERVRVELPGLALPRTPPVVYEDDDLLVLDKPAGLLTHAADSNRPAGRSAEWTVADLAEAHHGPLSRAHGNRRPGIVHRLDRDTSGLLVLARNDQVMRALVDQFRSRQVEKKYLALALGAPRDRRWCVERAIGPAPDGGDRQWLDPPDGGRDAATEFELLEQLGQLCLLSCTPVTGRRHQVRLHLCASGLELLGDRMYRPRPRPARAPDLPRPGRLCLHATSLRLTHPVSALSLSFTSPLPVELDQLLQAARGAQNPSPGKAGRIQANPVRPRA